MSQPKFAVGDVVRSKVDGQCFEITDVLYFGYLERFSIDPVTDRQGFAAKGYWYDGCQDDVYTFEDALERREPPATLTWEELRESINERPPELVPGVEF